MERVRHRRPHRVWLRYGVRASCGSSATVRNAESLDVLRGIFDRGGREGGLVAWSTVPGAILSRGDVPCIVHHACILCAHCVCPAGRFREIDTTVTLEGGPYGALVSCSGVSERLQ